MIAEEKFEVDYVDPVPRTPFFRIRETRIYGRVWSLTEDEAVELHSKLGEALYKLDD